MHFRLILSEKKSLSTPPKKLYGKSFGHSTREHVIISQILWLFFKYAYKYIHIHTDARIVCLSVCHRQYNVPGKVYSQ